jgi:DNA-binding LacI/PurR family transcriptional regulator
MRGERDSMIGVIAETISVLAAPPRGHLDRTTCSGWDSFIEAGAYHGIRDAGYHALTLNAKRLLKGGAGPFIMEKPVGVLVSCIAGESAIDIEIVDALAAAGVRIVAYGDTPRLAVHDRVSSDHAHGARELTAWLISRGRTRIVRLWPAGSSPPSWLARRDAGYEAALRDAGLASLPAVAFPFREIEGRRELFDEDVEMMMGTLAPLLSPPAPVDGIMSFSDRMTYTVAAALRRLGKEPARDVTVVGYDNYGTDCVEREWEPSGPSATVDKLNTQMGRDMVRLLLDRVEDRLPPEPQLRLVTPKLVIGEGAATP